MVTFPRNVHQFGFGHCDIYIRDFNSKCRYSERCGTNHSCSEFLPPPGRGRGCCQCLKGVLAETLDVPIVPMDGFHLIFPAFFCPSRRLLVVSSDHCEYHCKFIFLGMLVVRGEYLYALAIKYFTFS